MKKYDKPTIITIILVCAMMLALTVYAWVEVVTGVDFSGIKVKPTEGKGLKIKKAEDASFSVAVNASMATAQNLSPVSTSDLINWYIPADNTQIQGDGSNGGGFVKINNAEAAGYYYHETLLLQSTVAYTSGLKVVRIDVTNASGNPVSSEVSKALRVGFKINTSNSAFIFAPVTGYDENYEAATGTNSTASVTLVNAPGYISRTPIDKTTTYEIEVYVWYEGQDSNLTYNNMINAEELVINVHFEGVE